MMMKFSFKPSGKQDNRKMCAGIIAVLLITVLLNPLSFLAGGFIAAHRLSEYAASVYNVESKALYVYGKIVVQKKGAKST